MPIGALSSRPEDEVRQVSLVVPGEPDQILVFYRHLYVTDTVDVLGVMTP